MGCVAIVGAQWGDEGKGKITDLLAERAAIVMRYQGGTNAGHTVRVGDITLKLHLVPSGILHEQVTCIMADGTVIDPIELAREVEELQKLGVSCENLLVSGNAHAIMPYHRLLDGLSEDVGGRRSLGTTRRGVGPAYTDKTARTPQSVRMWDLLDEAALRERIEDQLAVKNPIIQAVYGHEPLDAGEIFEQVWQAAQKIKRYIADIRPVVRQALAADALIILEGAQGTFLDLDYGTYPHVTSSHPVAGGACLGTGVPPKAIGSVILVAKAYTTRVGKGAFPTELEDKLADRIRERGGEYGTTTGRPRRCGWFDAVLVRAAVQINGADWLAVTKLDVLDGLNRVKVCVGYRYQGQVLEWPPGNLELMSEVEPVYEELPGWKDSTGGARSWDELPRNAKLYLERLEELVGARIGLVSVGPDREQTILRGDVEQLLGPAP